MATLYFGANQAPFPAIVDNLIIRTLAWEDEKKMLFLYDGVSCLCNMSFLGYAFFVALFSPRKHVHDKRFSVSLLDMDVPPYTAACVSMLCPAKKKNIYIYILLLLCLRASGFLQKLCIILLLFLKTRLTKPNGK